jgi:hypothetical protein
MGISALFLILLSHPISLSHKHTHTHTHAHTYTHTQQTALLFDEHAFINPALLFEHAFINQTTREAGTLKTNRCTLLHCDNPNKITGHDRITM